MKRFLSILLAVLMLTAAVPAVSVPAASGVKCVASGSRTAASDGYYYLLPMCSTKYVLSVMNGSKKSGAAATLGYYSYMSRRVFYLSKAPGGTYLIRNKNSGLYLGPKNGTKKRGGAIVQSGSKTSGANRWYVIRRGSYYTIQSSLSRYVMGVHNNAAKNAQIVNLQAYSNRSGQRWKLVKYTPAKTNVKKTAAKLKYKTTTRSGMTAADYAVLNNILGAVETGGQIYGRRNYGDYTPPYAASSNEHTCTLGWAAFYGEEAEALVRQIRQRDPKTFAKIDSKGIIARKLSVDWVKTRWRPNSTEVRLLKALITTPTGMKIQDEMATKIAKAYAARCMSGFTKNTYAVMMYCEIAHLGGSGAASRIFRRCGGTYNLDTIVASLKKDQSDTSSRYQVGDVIFWTRHMKCVEFIQRYA